MYRAKSGTYRLYTLTERFNGKPLPEVDIVDMREELKMGNDLSLSVPLRHAMMETREAGKQSILLLNRRGNSRALVCVDCRETPECPRCSVRLTYHSANNRLMCHYCGYSQPNPERCPSCGGPLKTIGTGTQKKRDQADEWYLKGLEILKKCRPANQEYLVYLMESFAIAARTERHNGAYQRALENIDEALVCFYKFKRQMEEKKQKLTYLHCLKLPYYLISKAGILLEMDCLAEAEQMYISAMNFFDAVSVDEFRKNTFRNLYVEILMRKNAYEEAKEIVMINLKYAFLYRGESYKDTLMCMEKLADIYVCLHRENEAVELYQKVLIHLRRDYPYQEHWIEKVCLKMNC